MANPPDNGNNSGNNDNSTDSTSSGDPNVQAGPPGNGWVWNEEFGGYWNPVTKEFWRRPAGRENDPNAPYTKVEYSGGPQSQLGKSDCYWNKSNQCFTSISFRIDDWKSNPEGIDYSLIWSSRSLGEGPGLYNHRSPLFDLIMCITPPRRPSVSRECIMDISQYCNPNDDPNSWRPDWLCTNCNTYSSCKECCKELYDSRPYNQDLDGSLIGGGAVTVVKDFIAKQFSDCLQVLSRPDYYRKLYQDIQNWVNYPIMEYPDPVFPQDETTLSPMFGAFTPTQVPWSGCFDFSSWDMYAKPNEYKEWLVQSRKFEWYNWYKGWKDNVIDPAWNGDHTVCDKLKNTLEKKLFEDLKNEKEAWDTFREKCRCRCQLCEQTWGCGEDLADDIKAGSACPGIGGSAGSGACVKSVGLSTFLVNKISDKPELRGEIYPRISTEYPYAIYSNLGYLYFNTSAILQTKK